MRQRVGGGSLARSPQDKSGGDIMGKSKDVKKDEKKRPKKTIDEKKKAKQEKVAKKAKDAI